MRGRRQKISFYKKLASVIKRIKVIVRLIEQVYVGNPSNHYVLSNFFVMHHMRERGLQKRHNALHGGTEAKIVYTGVILFVNNLFLATKRLRKKTASSCHSLR